MRESSGASQLSLKILGRQLKSLREQRSESLGEVCGAIEVDISKLVSIEEGSERPSEEILVLLINHFELKGAAAMQLWELAGYDNEADAPAKPAITIVAMDSRAALYTDGVEIFTNQAGLTMGFTQAINQNAPVARVAMSFEQAERVYQTLGQVLAKAKQPPRRLLAKAPVKNKKAAK